MYTNDSPRVWVYWDFPSVSPYNMIQILHSTEILIVDKKNFN